jgi:hypothetical protein
MQEKTCVLINSNSGNSYLVASTFGWDILTAADMPDLKPYSFIVIVCANTGDEELQPNMENFLLSLTIKNKSFAICELGNYFGFERDCFGCKKIVQQMLNNLEWKEIDNISIDSLPNIDMNIVHQWVKKIHEILDNSKK